MEEDRGSLELWHPRQRSESASETFIDFGEDTPPAIARAERSDNTLVLDGYEDHGRTPVAPEYVRAQREAREQRNELALELSKYFARLPEIMSLPAAHILAGYTPEEIADFEDMYRHLDTQLKNILRKFATKYTPPFPSFDDFLSHSSRALGQDALALRRATAWYSYLLPPHLRREVSGNLELYGAFAENIANAKYIQKNNLYME